MKTKEKRIPAFLNGGGEMGELIRSYDWSKTAIGSPDTWPQSLRSVVDIMLDSPFAMYIAWGSECIQLYNDGYRPILGATKHPHALGNGSRETYSEVWSTIGPMFEGVMEGKPIHITDFETQLDRNGFLEECVFDFSYSPIRLENGEVGGLLNIVIETTEKVKAVKALKESERRFQNLIREAHFGIVVLIGEEMRVDVVNKAYGRLIGSTPHELMGKPLFDVIPEAEELFYPMLNNVRLTGESLYLYDQPYSVGLDGKKIEGYLNVVYQAYKETDGTITGVIALCQDITETIKSRKKIKESENEFHTFADSIQNLAWIADGDGWIYWYNQQWYDYTGTTFEEMEGWGWEKVHHPDHIKKLEAFIKGAWKKDEAWEQTFPLRRHDGEYRWFLTRAYPVKDANGNIKRWIGTNTDIHDQKTIEEQKDEFISIASHEMKTPLTTAKGYIDLLLHSLSINDQSSIIYATKTDQALNRLNNLITDLLDVSKIQNGQLHYNITTFDFNELLDETIEDIQHSAENHTIQKTGNCTQQIRGDRNRLQQVLINLLSNAIKYSPSANKVLIEIVEQPEKIQIMVQDFGVGMSKQHLNKVFDRYYRVEEHATQFQGLGLGLYLSNNIVTRHGGTMWAESAEGGGSTFYFTLPVNGMQQP